VMPGIARPLSVSSRPTLRGGFDVFIDIVKRRFVRSLQAQVCGGFVVVRRRFSRTKLENV